MLVSKLRCYHIYPLHLSHHIYRGKQAVPLQWKFTHKLQPFLEGTRLAGETRILLIKIHMHWDWPFFLLAFLKPWHINPNDAGSHKLSFSWRGFLNSLIELASSNPEAGKKWLRRGGEESLAALPWSSVCLDLNFETPSAWKHYMPWKTGPGLYLYPLVALASCSCVAWAPRPENLFCNTRRLTLYFQT